MNKINKNGGEMREVLVSIIIPAYNVKDYICRCLDSVIKQSYTKIEVVVVDDGSTDESLDIINSYKNRFPQIFKVFHQENQGQSKARNYAMQYAQGEYVTFLDSDDYILPNYIETLVCVAKKNNSDMVCSGEYRITEEGKIVDTISYKEGYGGKCILRRLNFSGKLYKREFLEKHNIRFAENKIYEDNPFNIKTFALASNLKILDYIGYYQVVHVGSTTTKKISEEKLPFDEIERTIQYVNSNKKLVNDYELFQYTVLSFFTYFLFKANRKHYYFEITDRKSDQFVVQKLCDYIIRIVKEYFPNYVSNSYIRIFKYKEISFSQRMGVWIFVRLIKFRLLKKVIRLVYKF